MINENIKKKKINILNKQISIFTIGLILIAILLIIGLIFGIRYLVITLKYKTYSDKMYSYGLASLYDNQKAGSVTQKVNNKEFLKVTVAAIISEKKPSSLNKIDDNEYLEFKEILGVQNLTDNVTKSEMVINITKFAITMLKLDISPAKLEMSEKTLAKFTEDEKEIIGQAITMGLIKNKDSEVSNNYIIKGNLNKIIITLVEKYATVYPETIKFNEEGTLEKQDVNIVTENAKKPKNYKEFPYIVDNIQNRVYETDFVNKKDYNYQKPTEVYSMIGNSYGEIASTIRSHFVTLLNVDYENITVEDFLKQLNLDSIYYLEEDDVKDYIDYIKENKIKLKGNAEAMLPIICFSGESYLVRTKVTFEVVNSNTKDNLLYMDEKTTYEGNKFEFYLDLPMGMTVNSTTLKVYVGSLANRIAINDNKNITIEK